MSKCRLLILSIFSLLCISFVAGFFTGMSQLKREIIPPSLVKGTAHTSAESQSYRLVFSDEDSDVAYYEPIDDLLTELSVGSIVCNIYGESGILRSLTPTGFTVDAAEMHLSAGDSETPIFYQDHVIGYVSTKVNDGSLYCIWK